MLDTWPALPIVIEVDNHETLDIDHIIATLEHNDRICRLDLNNALGSQLDKVFPAMQQPFLALTHLHLGYGDETTSVQPDSFLGTSTPRLQSLSLHCIPFPGLPNLLLSATHIVTLELQDIPLSGYISPEAMVAALSVLTCLENLDLMFESPLSFPDRKSRRLPPQTRTLLPVLNDFWFRGVCEYLEDLVAQIDAPLLDKFALNFFPQHIFDTTQLTQLITRTPNFKAHDKACVVFSDSEACVLFSQTSDGELELGISCGQRDLQVSSLAQICSSSLPRDFIPVVETLHVVGDEFPPLHLPDDFERSQWLELLRPFAAVKGLHVSRELVPLIALALQELDGDRVAETLPALQTLFLGGLLPSGPVQEAIGQFVAARQLAGHPIAISSSQFEVH
jgi:hypothetical protein